MPWVPRQIGESRVAPALAKQVRLQCPHCHGFAFANIPWDATSERRQQEIKKAIDEHRGVCTGADAIEGRVYQIDYPRA
jgi:hypothetical protein